MDLAIATKSTNPVDASHPDVAVSTTTHSCSKRNDDAQDIPANHCTGARAIGWPRIRGRRLRKKSWCCLRSKTICENRQGVVRVLLRCKNCIRCSGEVCSNGRLVANPTYAPRGLRPN